MPRTRHSLPILVGAAAFTIVTVIAANRHSLADALVLVEEGPVDDGSEMLGEEEEQPVVLHTVHSELDLSDIDPASSVRAHLSLFNVNTRESLSMHLPLDGTELSKDDAGHLTDFLRCHLTQRRRRIHTRVFTLLADIAREYPGHTIEIVSGYRARPYGVPKSRHFRGRAIDFRVRGVPVDDVRDYLWRTHGDIGLGHYHSENFLHLDHRPVTPKIAWNQRRKKSPYRYHPSWATSQVLPTVALAKK